MGNFDFQNDFENDAARKNYDAAMNGKRRSGLDIFRKPHLWEEERPCDIKDTPRENFVPIPTIGTGDTFAGYSISRKISFLAGAALVLGFIGYCVGFAVATGLF